jgi:hypothetical protein
MVACFVPSRGARFVAPAGVLGAVFFAGAAVVVAVAVFAPLAACVGIHRIMRNSQLSQASDNLFENFEGDFRSRTLKLRNRGVS